MKRINGLHIAIAAVVIANAMALRHAAANRSGPYDAEVVLTERELQHWQQRETSAVFLNLAYNFPDQRSPTEWISEQQLRELGFDLNVPPKDPRARKVYESQSPRRVVAAFEYDGPAWAATAEARERMKTEIKDPWITKSRLVPVALANDVASLRSRFPDRTKVILLPVVVRLWAGELRIHASITDVPTRIYVPSELSRGFDRMTDRTPDSRQRYKVRVRFGANLEPWVTAVEFAQ